MKRALALTRRGSEVLRGRKKRKRVWYYSIKQERGIPSEASGGRKSVERHTSDRGSKSIHVSERKQRTRQTFTKERMKNNDSRSKKN